MPTAGMGTVLTLLEWVHATLSLAALGIGACAVMRNPERIDAWTKHIARWWVTNMHSR